MCVGYRMGQGRAATLLGSVVGIRTRRCAGDRLGKEALMLDLGGIHKQVVKAAMSAPYLQRDEELDLALRWATGQDEEALHALASSHIRLVIAIASRFRNYG